MNVSFAQLKADARGHLAGRYGAIVVAYMIAQLLTSLPSLFIPTAGIANSLFANLIDLAVSFIVVLLNGIFVVGQNYICLKYARFRVYAMPNDMWYGFKGLADITIKVVFFVYFKIFVHFIPFLFVSYAYNNLLHTDSALILLIITGVYGIFRCIVTLLEFTPALFLVVDHPDDPAYKILTDSRELMKGNRMKLFLLQLSFIGYYILSFLSLGIGLYWVYPYRKMTLCEFYLTITGEIHKEIVLEGDPSDPNYYKEVY